MFFDIYQVPVTHCEAVSTPRLGISALSQRCLTPGLCTGNSLWVIWYWSAQKEKNLYFYFHMTKPFILKKQVHCLSPT